MILEIECLYCGYKWERNVYMRTSMDNEKCLKCKDSHLKVRDMNDVKVNYYLGSPDFPSDKPDDPDPYDTFT